jgi:hypothetical protein
MNLYRVWVVHLAQMEKAYDVDNQYTVIHPFAS